MSLSVTHRGIFYRAADTHAHIYPGKIAEKATVSVGDFYHMDMLNVGLPHVLAEQGKAAGIDRFLVCSVATKVEQVRSINEFIEKKCGEYPQFIGLAAWHQEIEDMTAELDDIQRRGLKGIKLHPDFQKFFIDDEKMFSFYKEADRRGLPILFHMGDSRMDFSSPRRLMNVLEKLPELTCIAAHLGGYTEWEEARRILRGTNVYVDTSSSLFALTKEEARKSIEHFGVEHTMFGTDFPMWNPVKEVERFFALELSEEENRHILYDNFARLFHLEEMEQEKDSPNG